MATPFDPSTAVDFDEPLNTDPDFSSLHIFSTDDVTATFDGATQGKDGDTLGIIDFTEAHGTKVTADGVTLYPVDSEFGFYVTDFVGAESKVLDGDYAEGWVGDLMIEGQQAGIVISDSRTDTFKTPAVLGTWLTGLGSSTVKASTEHYTAMQAVLSDQAFPGDPDALYTLDDDLILLSLNEDWNGEYVQDILADPTTYGVTDANQDGVLDLKDLLNPNESTISYDIAYGTDYSVTMKDDGKLLYRWGNAIKRPNDVRLEATLETPDEWDEIDLSNSLKKLFSVSSAELVVHHTITNNPNDQLRPEDFENESAIGTLPTYEVIEDYNDEEGRIVWASTDDYYAGDGTLYEAGTILRDTKLVDAVSGSLIDQIGATSSDLDLGFTNAWYTTMDREPFEPVLNEDGTEYITGPRWRLLPDKYGQDLPSVTIPLDPSAPLPTQNGEEKYEVGAETQTVINLLDWATDISPLNISAGWQDNAGSVSANGLNLTDDFDLAVYIKGDIKPATVYSAELLVDYEEIALHAEGTNITGTDGDDYLVGIGENVFNGGAGSDLFVVSYGTSLTDVVTASVIEDFEVGKDKLGLIGFDALEDFDPEVVAKAAVISQGVDGDDLTVFVDGELVATLTGLAAELGVGATVDAGEGLSLLDSFFVSNPGEGEEPSDEDLFLINDEGFAVSSFSVSQDLGIAEVSADGTSLTVSDNGWKTVMRDTTITEDTVISFDFEASETAEIYAISFETDDHASTSTSFQLAGSQLWGNQAYADDYTLGDGVQRMELDVGQYITGDFDRIVFITDDDAAGGGEATFANVTIEDAEPGFLINDESFEISSFSASQDFGIADVSDGGASLTVSDNGWKTAMRDTTITENTVISFDFEASETAEIYAIAFETDDSASTSTAFQLAGSQTWGNQSFIDIYDLGDGVQRIEMEVGQHITGDFDRIVFITDDDAAGGGEATFSNMMIDGVVTDDLLFV